MRGNADVRAIEMFLTFAPAVAVTFLGFAVALALMLSIHVGLTLAAVSTLPLVLLLGVRMRRSLFPLAWLLQARMADVATVVEENLAGAHVVRAFSQERNEVNRLERAAERLRWIAVEEGDARSVYQPLVENLPRLGTAAVVRYGGVLAIQDSITLGALVAFSIYITLLQMPFRVLGLLIVLGQRAAAAASRIFELIDEEPTVVERPGAIDLQRPRGEVRFEQVRFGYADGPDVLDGFDLHLAPGETVALVGPTGAGKSTAARLLPRFHDVRAGRVTLDGHDVGDVTLSSLRHHVGVVPDEPFLFSASIRDNIAYAKPAATMDEIVAAAEAAGADDFIDQMPDGYETVVGERG